MDINHVEYYLNDVKKLIRSGRCRIVLNNRRQKNRRLFSEYVIDEAKSKEILLSLTAYDFSEAVRNEHSGFEHEWLYIFGKNVKLLLRFGFLEEDVPLYIKLNRLENQFIIVISFHRQEYPLDYAFR
jgi:hypothetical protein